MNHRMRLAALAAAGILLIGMLTGCGNSRNAGDTGNRAAKSSQTTGQQDGGGTEPESAAFESLIKFTCETLDGGSFTEKNLAEKDLTIMNFWTTSCPPCIQEMPELEELRNILPDNVQLLLVSLDNPSAMEDVKRIIQERGYMGTVALCGDGDMESLSRQLMYTPTTLFFDKDGQELGSAIIGSPKELRSTYTETVDRLLQDMGKEAVWKN